MSGLGEYKAVLARVLADNGYVVGGTNPKGEYKRLQAVASAEFHAAQGTVKASKKSAAAIKAGRVARGKALAALNAQMRQAGTMPKRGWGKKAPVSEVRPGLGMFQGQQGYQAPRQIAQQTQQARERRRAVNQAFLQSGGGCQLNPAGTGRCVNYEGANTADCVGPVKGRCRKTGGRATKSAAAIRAGRVARGKALAARNAQMRQAGTMPKRGQGKNAVRNYRKTRVAKGEGWFFQQAAQKAASKRGRKPTAAQKVQQALQQQQQQGAGYYF